MERRFRLTRTTDFLRVRRSGKSYAHPLVVLIASLKMDDSTIRIGVTASRAVGNAVQRNRAKRRLRACLSPMLPSIKAGSDLVFLARKPLVEAPYEQICATVRSLLQRAGLLEELDGS